MFKWYQGSEKCYVCLDDISSRSVDLEAAFAKTEWFERGWTLQELLAPASVQFFSQEHNLLGDRNSLDILIHNVTGIDLSALRGRKLHSFIVDERMRWAVTRKTTREEDQAYSLVGIFGLSMTARYGEGRERAMTRLEKKLGKTQSNLVTQPPASLLPKLTPRSIVPFRRDRGFVDVGILNDMIDRCSEPASCTALVGLGCVGYH